ncbi:YoaK family protein [Methylocapsa palsarum]|uniref:Uncharacterized membrane protein YoaK, UPF0700 family n=1 Tax=Methylocapsa palsarum TaxID=1612308 RepID=A0A1I3XYG5_9HYPH|nr:YoaK family protein [Methylocapsa palsarum]SFK24036.1 Uncharacterized membrane protein YoaK, UPF0700 family [Methylocapsa palsarum]
MKDAASASERFDAADAGLALLGLAAGSMDALAFFHLAAVFPSAMTGNTALLGLALGRGDLVAASSPLTAFAGFFVGAALAARIDLAARGRPASRVVVLLLAIETGLLAAFVAGWRLGGPPSHGAGAYGLIGIASLAMGVQSAAARLVGRSGISTVVFTSTLTSIAAAVAEALDRRPRALSCAALRQAGIVLSYGAGAVLAGLLAAHKPSVVFLPLLAVLGALAFLRRAGPGAGNPAIRPDASP